jgi:hypothetical protein
MRSVKCSVRTDAAAWRGPLSNPLCWIEAFRLRYLIVALVMALAGCATSDRAPVAPPIYVPKSTWLQVDRDIGAASLAATGSARNYALGAMDKWRASVHKRNETDFIPWFTSYWTQQRLAIKVAWYKLGSEEGMDPVEKKLAAYLQDQYNDRVLEPVAGKIDPDAVRERSTALYIQLLGEQIKGIPQRYGVPLDQFDQRIQDIPAIVLATHPVHSASLYQIVHADPIAKLPAYEALVAQIRNDAGGTEVGPSDTRISPVAEQASKKLLDRIATNVGASAAAAAVGGVPGIIISMGAFGYGAITHDKERPKMEAQLRESLDAALDDMWLRLVENNATGVMAGVHYLSRQIEGSLVTVATQPVEPEPAMRDLPLSGE